MSDHKILGFAIRQKTPTRIVGIIFILLGLLTTLMGVVYFLSGLESRMATDGSDLYSQATIIYVDHPSSPLLYFCGVMTIAGGLILLNNAFKLLLNKSPLHVLLTRSILSSVFLFLLIGLQTAVFLGMRGSSFALDLRPVMILGIVFFVVLLVFFIIKKIYRNRLIATYWAALPVFVIIVCLIAAIGIISQIRYHRDPDKAAQAFASTNHEIKNSANFLFAESDDRRVDIAKLTPDLMRALIRHNVRIPQDQFAGRGGPFPPQLSGVNTELQKLVKIDEIPQVPLPGWTPMIILLLAIIAFKALRKLKNSWTYLAKPENMVGLFGWINLFLLYWFGVASAGGLDNIYLTGKLTNPAAASIADAENIVNGGMLMGFICAAILISTTRNRLRSGLPVHVKRGWIIFFYFVNLFALAGVYAMSYKSSATPVLPWLFVYNLLSALSCWIAIYFQKQPV